jgi:uncharacterized membrane protein YkoI
MPQPGQPGSARRPAATTRPSKTSSANSPAATTAVPGTILRYDLAKPGSAIVYEITVQPQAGGVPVQVLVDAGTGKVLKTQPAQATPPER